MPPQLVAERAAVLLQARVRAWLARRTYRRVRAAVVFTQCCARRRAARRALMKLKTEARSVEKFRELNKGMEVKLMQLQLRADQEVGEGSSITVTILSSIHALKLCLLACVQAREAAALKETLHAERQAASAELEALRATVQKLGSQKREKPRPCTVTSEKEAEERMRAEEKAAQEILQLTQVRPTRPGMGSF